MKLSVALISGDALTGRKTIARSTDPHLVLYVITALRNNRLLEDDEEDETFDPALITEAEQWMARLADRVRQKAGGLLPEMEDHSHVEARSERVEARSEIDGF